MHFPLCTTLAECRNLTCCIYTVIQLKLFLFLSNSFWPMCYLNISLSFKLQCSFRYFIVIAFNMILLWLLNTVYNVLILQHLWHPLRLILWFNMVYLDECFICTWKEHVFCSCWVQCSVTSIRSLLSQVPQDADSARMIWKQKVYWRVSPWLTAVCKREKHTWAEGGVELEYSFHRGLSWSYWEHGFGASL